MILIFYYLLMWKYLIKDAYQNLKRSLYKGIAHKIHVTIISINLVFKNYFVLKEMFKFLINNYKQIFFKF